MFYNKCELYINQDSVINAVIIMCNFVFNFVIEKYATKNRYLYLLVLFRSDKFVLLRTRWV